MILIGSGNEWIGTRLAIIYKPTTAYGKQDRKQ